MLMAAPSKERELDKHADAIRDLRKSAANSIVEIGKHLIEARKIAGRGNWLPWLKREFDWSERTAYNYITVAKTKIANFANLKVPVSSMYLLSSPSTPKAVVDEIITKTKSGKVSGKTVAKTVKAAKPVKATKAKAETKPKTSPKDRVAREAEKTARPVPLNRQVNLIFEPLDHYLSQFCQEAGEWYEAHRSVLDAEDAAVAAGEGETHLSGKEAIKQSIQSGVDRLVRLAEIIGH